MHSKKAVDCREVSLLAEEMVQTPERFKLVQHSAGNGMVTVTIAVGTKDDEDGWHFLGQCLSVFQQLDSKTSSMWLADRTRPIEHLTKLAKPECKCLIAAYDMETQEILSKVRALVDALNQLGADTSTIGWPPRFHDRNWYNWTSTLDYAGTHITFTCNPKTSPTFQLLLKHKLVCF